MTNPGKRNAPAGVGGWGEEGETNWPLTLRGPACCKTGLQLFGHPRASVWYNMVAGFRGGREGERVAREGGTNGGVRKKKCSGSHVYENMVNLPESPWAKVLIVPAGKLMTRPLLEHAWALLAPQWAAACVSHLDESFQERKYGESVRIASCGRLPLARSALIALPYFFNRRAKEKCSSRLCSPTVDYCNHIWLWHWCLIWKCTYSFDFHVSGAFVWFSECGLEMIEG